MMVANNPHQPSRYQLPSDSITHNDDFGRITRLAARIVQAPYARLDVVIGTQIEVASVTGVGPLAATLWNAEADLAPTLATLHSAVPQVVEDLAASSGQQPSAATERHSIRSYLAVPLVAAEGVVGALAVLDTVPRSWDATDLAMMHDLASLVVEGVVRTNKRAQRQLSPSVEEALRLASELLDEGVVITDQHNQLRYISPRMTELSGYAAEHLAGQSAWQLLAPQRGEGGIHEWGEWVPNEQPQEAQFVRRDGTSWWATVVGTPLYGLDGAQVGTVARFSDISEQRQLQEQLILAQRRECIGQIAIGVTHDFNNLLTIMLGSAQLAMADLDADSQLKSDLDEIYRSGMRAAQLTRQLLAFARQRVGTPQVVDVSALLVNLGRLLRHALKNDIELVVLPSEEVALVTISPGQLEQLLLNVSLRAQARMPCGGTLSIASRLETVGPGHTSNLAPGTYVALTVHDTGCHKGGAATQGVAVENDFGLAASLSIVRQHGWHMLYERREGRGTTTYIFMPAVEGNDAMSNTVPSPRKLPGGQETLLLVEDEASVRSLTARFLRDRGYTVIEATNGDEALRLVEDTASPPIQLVLADIVMPRMGGAELMTRLRRRYPDLRVILMSGYTEIEVGDEQLARVAFLYKPFLPSDLAYRVRELLDS